MSSVPSLGCCLHLVQRRKLQQLCDVAEKKGALGTSLQNGLVGSPCSPRDSQESSSTPQFKSINFSALSFLHSPTLTSIHDHWKNHSLDQMDLCWQSNVSDLNMPSRLVITFLPRNKRLLISWLQSSSIIQSKFQKFLSSKEFVHFKCVLN